MPEKAGSSPGPRTSHDPTMKPMFLGFLKNKEQNAALKDWRTQLATLAGSFTSTAVAYPLDFTKSRMQSYNAGFIHTIKDTYKAEGLKAFFRGIGPPLISVTGVRVISMSLYQKLKYKNDEIIYRFSGKSPLAQANAPNTYPTPLTLLCFGTAGAASGMIVTTLSCPFELTKLSEQLAGKMARDAKTTKDLSNSPGSAGVTSQAANKKSGSWQTAVRLYRDRGLFRGLYAGYRLHLLRDTIGTSIYFMTYESVKQLMANARGKSPTNPLAVMLAGMCCGIFSWSIIYPVDVVKTQYQKALLSIDGPANRPKIDFFKRANYRGIFVSAMRSGVTNTVFFSIFEFMKKEINSLDS